MENGKPYLLIVAGRPGAGKTTLAQALSKEIWMPVISRDQIKEGYVHTAGQPHRALPESVNRTVTETFFETLHFLLDHRISVIAEAAFQHTVWSAQLPSFMSKAAVRLILCRTDGTIALERFVQRGLEDERREHFHGDKGVEMARRGTWPMVSDYQEPVLDCPTFYVDTTHGYCPTIAELADTIFKEQAEG